MTTRAPQAYVNVERLIERRYARKGAAYIWDYYGAAIALTMVFFALAALGLTVNFGGSTKDGLLLLAIVEGLIVIILPATYLIWKRTYGRAAMAWLQGDRSPATAPAAWAGVLAAPIQLPIMNFLIAFPFQVAGTLVAVSILDTGSAGFPVIVGGIALVASGVAGLTIFGAQFAIRPILRDIAGYLPPDASFVRSRFGLARQLIMRLVVVGMAAVLTGGVIMVISEDQVGRLALLVTLGPVMVLALGAIVFPLASFALVSPVNELIDATRRVADGDLDATVPVLTSDEMGELAYSFNAMTADLRRITEDLREASARIVASSDAARRKVERDLHDGAQQRFVLVNLKLGLLERTQGDDPQAAAALVAELRQDIERGLAELRELAHGIYPAVLENEGLGGALRDAATRTAMPVSVESDATRRYEPELEAAVYFCCLEALQNAAKHAGSDAGATVRLWAGVTGLRFEVVDDGAGFEAAAGADSAGLQNMADRIGALGGELSVESAPGRGTTVSGRVPV